MRAEDLDREIAVERAEQAVDVFGGLVFDWVSLGTVWAQVIWISDGERWRAGEVAAHVTTRFRIRWGLGVTVTDRILFEDRIYDVHSVKEIGRREGQEITASARADLPVAAITPGPARGFADGFSPGFG